MRSQGNRPFSEWTAPAFGAASHLAGVEIFDLASVSHSMRSVSNDVRQSIPSVSANLRRKLPLIARRAVYDCAPLHVRASVRARSILSSRPALPQVDARSRAQGPAVAGP